MKLSQKIWTALIPTAVLSGGLFLISGNVSAASDGTEASGMTSNVAVATPVTTIPEESETAAGWIEESDGRKYIQTDGTYATGIVTIDHVTYVFDETGVQQVGWQSLSGVRHYYFPETGEAAVGVQEIDGIAYLFDFTGSQKTGWRTVEGVRRYYDPQIGELLSGWVSSYDQKYYVDETQGKLTGEITIDDVRYQMDGTYGYQNLGMCTFSDGTTSYYAEDGAPVSGWLELQGRMYYFDTQYQMVTGFQEIDNATYYFRESGVRVTGWQNIDGDRYYFAEDGAMVSGFFQYRGSTYYLAADGKMQTGWHTIDEKRYYFNASGQMLRSWQTIDGKKYYFNATGQMVKSWQTIGNNRYYFSADGVLQTGFLTLSTGTYYMNADGVMQTGWQTIDGKKYYFQTNGVMLRGQRFEGYIIDADGVATEIQYPKAVAVLDKVGWDLKKAFQWASSLTYYGHTADMPQDASPGIEWYADYGFDHLKGNCYVMAATFCEMARTLGYNAQQISGKVPLRSGGLGPHSWVEIIINGTTYVFDPNFTHDTGRNGYQITYGQSGTWRYVRQTVMSD